FLLERGIAVRQGLRFLRAELPGILATRNDVLSPRMLRLVEDLAADWRRLDERIEEAGITVTLPKPMTSNSKAAGRFDKQDFRYLAAEDAYICPAGERLAYRYTNEENGLLLHRYWTNACQSCAIKHSCTTGKER